MSLFKILPLDGFSPIRAKQMLHRRRKRVYESSSSRHKKTKVIKTDNSRKFGKSSEDLSWNHRTPKPHRAETDGIAERAVRRVKGGTSAVVLQSGLDEIWWAGSICEMRKLLMRSDLGPWLNIIRFLNETSLSFINFARKFCQEYSTRCGLIAGRIWKEDILEESTRKKY